MNAVFEHLLAALLQAWVWLVSEEPTIIASLAAHVDRVFVQRHLITGEPVDAVVGVLLLSVAVAIAGGLLRKLILRAVAR